MQEHRIAYEITLRFNDDGITANIRGDSISFVKDTPEVVLRPRHVKAVTEITDFMRERIFK